MHSLHTIPSDVLMVDRALVNFYLRPDFVHTSAWNQILASSQLYLYDFENPLVSASAACRVLISGGCFAFSSSMSISPSSLQPYFLCLWARQFGFQ